MEEEKLDSSQEFVSFRLQLGLHMRNRRIAARALDYFMIVVDDESMQPRGLISIRGQKLEIRVCPFIRIASFQELNKAMQQHPSPLRPHYLSQVKDFIPLLLFPAPPPHFLLLLFSSSSLTCHVCWVRSRGVYQKAAQ